MENKIWVDVEAKAKEKVFLRCYQRKIEIFEAKEEKGILSLKILEKDYAKIKRLWFVKVKKSRATGLLYWKEKIFTYRVLVVSIFFGFFLLFFISHIMIQVEVIHSNKEIRDLVSSSLKEKGLKKNTWKMSYEELKQIKEEILEEYPDRLEWLEIEIHGMKYVVRVEERKIETQKEEKTACHVVATKDGLVKEMIFQKGQAVVSRNDAVTKGTILISGIITKDGEEKGVVCAEGKVYGEVWYQISASVPMNYEVTERTNKKRWNLRFKNLYYDQLIFRSRLENYEEEKKKVLDIWGNELYFVVQYETKKEQKKYTEEEASNLAFEKAIEKLASTLDENEKILEKKVLKKEINHSTMNIEVFVSTLESIGEVQEFEKNEKE